MICGRRVRISGLLAPCPIEAKVGVVFRLAGEGVAVTEKQLIALVSVEFVVTAEIEQRGGVGLWSGRAFRSVEESFCSERPFLAQVSLHQPARERIVPVSRDISADNRLSATAIGGPGAEAL